MKHKLGAFLIGLLFVVGIGCKKPVNYEPASVDFSDEKLISSTNGSLIATAKIDWDEGETVSEHGFVTYNQNEITSLLFNDSLLFIKTQMGKLSQKGLVEKELNGITIHSTSIVRPYAKTNGRIHLGKEITFSGLNDNLPLNLFTNTDNTYDTTGFMFEVNQNIIYGGGRVGTNDNRACKKLNLSSGNEVMVDSLPVSSGITDAATAVVASDGFLFGGRYNGNTCSDKVLKYNGASDTWSAVNSLPQAALGMVAVACNQKIYTGFGRLQDNTHSAHLYCYDPITNSFSTLPDPPADFQSASNIAAFCIGNMLYFSCGMKYKAGNYERLTQFLSFNTQTLAWEYLGELPFTIDRPCAFTHNNTGYIASSILKKDNYPYQSLIMGYLPDEKKWFLYYDGKSTPTLNGLVNGAAIFNNQVLLLTKSSNSSNLIRVK